MRSLCTDTLRDMLRVQHDARPYSDVLRRRAISVLEEHATERVTLESGPDGYTAFDIEDGAYLPCHVFTGWEGAQS